VIEKDPLVGTRLADRYEVLSVLGRGGMGVVYKVRHEQMDRFMAVKMLHSHLVSETEAVRRFRREAKTVSQVRHHHIITLYDFGMSAQHQPYLVMDYLEGTSLKCILKDEGCVPFERADKIYQQVIDALATAHGMELTHRDLKPENIMLTKRDDEDWVTLVDFGLSKLKDKQEDAYQITKVGDVCGSPPYMSPEQCLSSTAIDARSDIYSLAVCVYETLSCKLPFAAKSAIEMLDAHLYATPIPFNQALPEFKVCSEVTHVLNKALAKEPEKRQQTVEEFGKELHDAINRDSLKLRTFKHRIEVANFRDLISEAEALQKQEQGGGAEPGAALEGMQFVHNQSSDNGGDAEFLRCPTCKMPFDLGTTYCAKCRHQYTTEELIKLRAKANSKKGETGKGFSSRAKVATTGSGIMPVLQKLVAFLFLLFLGFGAYVYFFDHAALNSITKLVSGQ